MSHTRKLTDNETTLYYENRQRSSSPERHISFEQEQVETTVYNVRTKVNKQPIPGAVRRNPSLPKNPRFHLVRNDQLYCVPRLLRPFGLVVENKVYGYEDLLILASINDCGFVCVSTSVGFIVDSMSPNIYLLKCNANFTHAQSCTFYNGQPVHTPDDFDYSSVALASTMNDRFRSYTNNVRGRQRSRPQTRSTRVVEVAPPVKRRQNRKKKMAIKEEVIVTKKKQSSKPKVVEKVYKIPYTKLTQPKKVKRSNVDPHKGRVVSISPELLFEQCTMPYNVKALTNYPDSMGQDSALQKSFTNIDINPSFVTFTGAIKQYYLSIIHAGTIWDQYLLGSLAFNTPKLTFTLCCLQSTSNDTLQDNIAFWAGAPVLKRFLSFVTTPKVYFPWHSATSELIDSDGTDTDASYFFQAGEVYDQNNNVVPFNKSSVPAGCAFAMANTSGTVQEYLTFEATLTANSEPSLTFNLEVSLGTGAITVIPVYTVALTVGSNSLYFSISTGNASDGIPVINTVRFDKIHGLFVSSDTPEDVGNWAFIEFIVQTNSNQVAFNTSTQVAQPFSRYNGTPVVDSSTILSLTTEYRNIASSFLLSDFSNQFTSAGVLRVAQVYSGKYPTETSVNGIASIAKFPQVYDGKCANGFYSTPVKTVSVTSRSFRAANENWLAAQPYTVFYGYFPSPSTTNNVQFLLRAQICDIFELLTTNQQIWQTSSVVSNPSVINAIESRPRLICENPFHFSDIFAIGKQIISKSLPFIELAASVTGNKYLGAAATVGQAITS
jgi:hypothetical protein